MQTPIEEIKNDFLFQHEVRLFIKRDDLIHPFISGNKFRKLKYNLEKARQENHQTLLTFGGAYSNHIYAAAAAGSIHGFNTIGIIRGEEYPHLNPTLTSAAGMGMKLHYVSRKNYKKKYNGEFLKELKEIYGSFYLIPEGGSNPEAIKGVKEMINEIGKDMDILCVSCGTGGTLAGILAGLNGDQYVIGFPAIRNGGFLKKEVTLLIKSFNARVYSNWHLETDYHCGGYAKYTMDLIEFINDFKRQFNIPLDPLYTGKMMYGIFDLIKKSFIKKGQRVMAIHTGGLQGIQGFNERFGNLIQ